jgi:hypothetical protein
MPKKGYYIKGAFEEAIYTTGQTGGGGHKWARPSQFPGWATLNWNCVPSEKRIQEEKWQYYEQLPPQAIFQGIVPLEVLDPKAMKPKKKKAKAKKWNVATDLATNNLVADIQEAMEDEGLDAPSAEDYYGELETNMAAKLEAQGLKPAVISHVKILNEENVEDKFDKMMLGIDEYFRPELVIARNSGHEPVFRIHYKEDTWTMSNTAPTWKYKIEFHQNVCVLHRKTGKTSFKFQIDYLNFWDAGEIVKALINPIASEDKIGFMGHMVKPFEVPLEILQAQADQAEAVEEDSAPIGKRKLLI